MKKLKLILLAWLPVFVWMIYAYSHGGGYINTFKWINPYNHSLRGITFWTMLQRIFINAKNMPIFSLPEIFNYVFASVFGFFMLIGIGQTWHDKKYQILLWYAVIFLGVTWLLPSMWLAGRYYLPLLPIFCIFAVKGIETQKRNIREKLILAFMAISMIVVFTQAKWTWTENIAYTKNQEYPKRRKYLYFNLYQKAFRESKIDPSKQYKSRKSEVFLWIKNQER